MSINAGAYYQSRAEAVGVALAPCLDGRLVTLLKDGRLSLHQPSGVTVEAIAKCAGEIIGAAGVLATAEARKQLEVSDGYPRLPMAHVEFVQGTLLRCLSPTGLQTGHFSGMTLEALSRSEFTDLLPSLTAKVRGRAVELLGTPDEESRQAYLLATGFFKTSGRPPVRTGALTLLKAEASSLIPRYYSVALGRNALLGASLAKDSAVTGRAVRGAAMLSPSLIPSGNTR